MIGGETAMDSGKVIARVIKYIEKYFNNQQLTAQDVAQEIGYSADYLSRLFMARTGYTIAAYIGRCRLSSSAEKLRQTDISVLEIALGVGFASHEGFIRAFRKQYRITPSVYRRLHRQTQNYVKNRKGEISHMNTNLEIPFITDDEVIGKWERVTVTEPTEIFNPAVYMEKTSLGYSEIYFLPQGQGYWIFEGWTKGNLIIHYGGDEPVLCYNYRIKTLNGQMYLFLDIEEDGVPYVEILKKVSDKHFDRWEIGRHDDTDIPFVLDNKVVGKWIAVDYVLTPQEFKGEPTYKTLWLQSVEFVADGRAVRNYGGEEWQDRWTEGALIDTQHTTVQHYTFETCNGKEYLFLEWKTGNYVYGGFPPSYYVFTRYLNEI